MADIEMRALGATSLYAASPLTTQVPLSSFPVQ
jgi:hypothetical protein